MSDGVMFDRRSAGRISRAIRDLERQPPTTEIYRAHRVYDSGGSDMDFSQFSFGWSTTLSEGTTYPGWIRVIEGDIIRASYTPITVPDIDIEITTDPCYVYVECDWNLTSASVQVSGSKPTHDATSMRRVIHEWRLIAGAASFVKMRSVGDIDLTTLYGL